MAVGDKIANFSKGLHHNELAIVEPNGYNAFLRALTTGNPDDFEAIPMVGKAKLTNPQAGLAYELAGGDMHSYKTPLAPAYDSAWSAGEIAENYWLALLRDVPFNEYDNHPLAQEAAADLSRLSDFRGPKSNKAVTPHTLFRGQTPGAAMYRQAPCVRLAASALQEAV